MVDPNVAPNLATRRRRGQVATPSTNRADIIRQYQAAHKGKKPSTRSINATIARRTGTVKPGGRATGTAGRPKSLGASGTRAVPRGGPQPARRPGGMTTVNTRAVVPGAPRNPATGMGSRPTGGSTGRQGAMGAAGPQRPQGPGGGGTSPVRNPAAGGPQPTGARRPGSSPVRNPAAGGLQPYGRPMGTSPVRNPAAGGPQPTGRRSAGLVPQAVSTPTSAAIQEFKRRLPKPQGR
jgi:hypothetical protein